MTETINVTREYILGLKPSRELDSLVGKYVVREAPEIKWFAVNQKETIIHMDFNYQSEANTWLEFDSKHLPEHDVKIVRREIYRKFSESISAAMEVEKAVGVVEYRWRYVDHITRFFLRTQGSCEVYDMMQASPEVRCKSALLTIFGL